MYTILWRWISSLLLLAALFFNLRKKLELTSFPMQEIYDRFGKISTGGCSNRNIYDNQVRRQGGFVSSKPLPIGSSTFQVYRLTLILDLRLCRCSNQRWQSHRNRIESNVFFSKISHPRIASIHIKKITSVIGSHK